MNVGSIHLDRHTNTGAFDARWTAERTSELEIRGSETCRKHKGRRRGDTTAGRFIAALACSDRPKRDLGQALLRRSVGHPKAWCAR